ncbi:MAG: hypothetical protein ACKVS9_20045 [Phycisphaerae bacterium]
MSARKIGRWILLHIAVVWLLFGLGLALRFYKKLNAPPRQNGGWLTASSWDIFLSLHATLWCAFGLVFLAVPGILLASSGKQIRSGPPKCDQCGYHLTGNTSGRCPECSESTDRGESPKVRQPEKSDPERHARPTEN